jgi:hypothetical protein
MITPARRRMALTLRREVQPEVARLLRNYESTLGRPPTDDELADFRLAADLLREIGDGLVRIGGGRRAA